MGVGQTKGVGATAREGLQGGRTARAKALAGQGGGHAGMWWIPCPATALRRPEMVKLPCSNPESLVGSEWAKKGRGGEVGGMEGACRARVPTHICAAPGSCSSRPGVGPGGSGSSADRPAWLNWGPRCTALCGRVPVRRGGACHTLLHARSLLPPSAGSHGPQPPLPRRTPDTHSRPLAPPPQTGWSEAQQEAPGGSQEGRGQSPEGWISTSRGRS